MGIFSNKSESASTMIINTTVYKSPIGELTLAKSSIGLCYLALHGLQTGLKPFLHKYYPDHVINDDAASFRDEIRQLDEYFAGQRRQFDLQLDLQAPPFYRQVLKEVGKIPYGQTRGYGDLAQQLGKPGSSRAVGGANAQNPLPIIIPCHRVLNSRGELNGYAGGLAMKASLLKLENNSFKKQ